MMYYIPIFQLITECRYNVVPEDYNEIANSPLSSAVAAIIPGPPGPGLHTEGKNTQAAFVDMMMGQTVVTNFWSL